LQIDWGLGIDDWGFDSEIGDLILRLKIEELIGDWL
jgi:hypothetical protein